MMCLFATSEGRDFQKKLEQQNKTVPQDERYSN